VTVTRPNELIGTVTLAGERVTVTVVGGAGATTVRDRVAVCVRLPDVAVMVTVAVPSVAVSVAVKTIGC
jgi:hypothetical protein